MERNHKVKVQAAGNFRLNIDAEWYPDESPEVSISWDIYEVIGYDSRHKLIDGVHPIASIEEWDANVKRIEELAKQFCERYETMLFDWQEKIDKRK